MHRGNINKPNTMAGRLYRLLQRRVEWDAFELQNALHTRCLATHIAEVRCQLRPLGVDVVYAMDRGRHGTYRLMPCRSSSRELPASVVRVEHAGVEQMDLDGVPVPESEMEWL